MANASSVPIDVEVRRRKLNLTGLMSLRLPRRRRLHVKISRIEIAPGDHIYTPRACGAFDHHGIYIGDDLVIHFQNSLNDKGALGSSIPRHGPCSVCGHHSGRSGVVLSCLDCFLRGGIIYRYQYEYCGLAMLKKIPIFALLLLNQMRWCTSAPSDPRETVIERGKLLLTDQFGEYNLLMNNCEDFALYCKTGDHIRSGQVMVPVLWPLAMLDLMGDLMLLSLLFFLFFFKSSNSSDFEALRTNNGNLYYNLGPRLRKWNWPLHCKRYLPKMKKRGTAGRISQPNSL